MHPLLWGLKVMFKSNKERKQVGNPYRHPVGIRFVYGSAAVRVHPERSVVSDATL